MKNKIPVIALFGEKGSGVERIQDWILSNISNTHKIDKYCKFIEKDKINIGIFFPSEIEELLKNKEYIVYPIYIETIDAAQRFYHILFEHKNNINWEFIDAAYLNTIRDFSKTTFKYAKIENYSYDIDTFKIALITDLIEKMPASQLLFGGRRYEK